MENRSVPISWEQYFMGIAKISALRSKDPVTKVGACIVNLNNHVVAVGYNGMPKGCDDSKMPWGKTSNNILETKHPFVVHAELNAILNSGGRKLEGTTLFVTLFPCCECAKAIIQVGIKKVIYENEKLDNNPLSVAARLMFDKAGVILKKYGAVKKSIEIEL